MDDREVAQIAVSAVGGGAIWQLARYFLGYFKLRSDKDGQIVDKTLEYSDSLRRDMESMRVEFRAENANLKAEIRKLRDELSDAHDTIRSMYEASLEHLKSCGKA